MTRGTTKTLIAVLMACCVTPWLGGCGQNCTAVGRANVLRVVVEGMPATGDVKGTICIDGTCVPAERSGPDAVMTMGSVPSEARDVRVDLHLTAPQRLDRTGLTATLERSGGGLMTCEPVWYHGEATADATP